MTAPQPTLFHRRSATFHTAPDGRRATRCGRYLDPSVVLEEGTPTRWVGGRLEVCPACATEEATVDDILGDVNRAVGYWTRRASLTNRGGHGLELEEVDGDEQVHRRHVRLDKVRAAMVSVALERLLRELDDDVVDEVVQRATFGEVRYS